MAPVMNNIIMATIIITLLAVIGCIATTLLTIIIVDKFRGVW